MLTGLFHRAIKLLHQGPVENVVDQRGFSGARDAGDQNQSAERKRDIDVFQIVGVRAEDGQRCAVRRAALGGNRNVRASSEILAGERARIRSDFRGRADGHEFAAGLARTRAEIHDVIGAADGFFVVLDDEDRVAEIAQRFKCAEQAAIVARVEADRRLIENVENAAKARADLRGEADALRFASRECGRGAIESEIGQADVEKKIEALGHFFERALGDGALALRQLRENAIYRHPGIAERQTCKIGNREAGDLHR